MKYANATKYLHDRGYRIFPHANGYLTRHPQYTGGIAFEVSTASGRTRNVQLNTGTHTIDCNSIKVAVEHHRTEQHRVTASLSSLRDTSTI